MSNKLIKKISRFVKDSDFNGAAVMLENQLTSAKHDRFRGLVGRGFTNKPSNVLSSVNGLLSACSTAFNVKAVYLEMNGFGINYDEWYFDSFGFDRYEPDPRNLDWLGDWQSPDCDEVPLIGLEDVQEDFRWYHENEIYEDKSYSPAYDTAVLLVIVKYVSLIEHALQSGELAHPVPVLATAHDFDTVARFEP